MSQRYSDVKNYLVLSGLVLVYKELHRRVESSPRSRATATFLLTTHPSTSEKIATVSHLFKDHIIFLAKHDLEVMTLKFTSWLICSRASINELRASLR
jgi:hypothetical protein